MDVLPTQLDLGHPKHSLSGARQVLRNHRLTITVLFSLNLLWISSLYGARRAFLQCISSPGL